MAAKNSQVTQTGIFTGPNHWLKGTFYQSIKAGGFFFVLVDLVEAGSFTDLNGCVSNVWT